MKNLFFYLLALSSGLPFSVQTTLCRFQQEESSTTRGGLKPNKKNPEYEPVLRSIKAFDGTTLAYGCYLPEEPDAAMIFYHGSGVNGNAGYPYMAEQLSIKYNIAVYLFDIRGHGRSSGARGDVAASWYIWEDVRSALQFVQTQYPHLPVFLGGHSGGAGMLINYATWPEHEQPDGYFLVTPMLGRDAHIMRDRQQKNERPFAVLNRFSLFVYYITGGWIGGSWQAIEFNYPERLIKERGFIKNYTVNMVEAMHPHAPVSTLSTIKVPVHIFIADQDELFDPIKIDNFLTPIMQLNNQVKATHLPGAYHLAVLGEVHDCIGNAITYD